MRRRHRILADRNWSHMRASNNAGVGVIPREDRYGAAHGMIPFGEAKPDKLVDPGDHKEVIARCHADKVFPMHHGDRHIWPEIPKWNQNGLPYCWAWGITLAMMHTRSAEGKPFVHLSPVTLGGAVNWMSRGNYLSSALQEIRTVGVAEMSYTPDQHSRNPRGFREGWEDNASQYRVGDVYDTPDRESEGTRLQYLISLLAMGVPVYVAYHWWGHAVMVAGVEWDESERNNVVVIVGNSHNNEDYIEMTGSRAIPNEMIGIASTLS